MPLPKATRHASVVIPLPHESAERLALAIAALAEEVKGGRSPARLFDRYPDTRPVAETLRERIVASEHCEPDDLRLLQVLPTGGDGPFEPGLLVRNAPAMNRIPIYAIAAIIQTAQQHFGAPAMRFEWSDFEPAARHPYGGGAMRVEQGREPELFDTSQLAAPGVAQLVFLQDAHSAMDRLSKREHYDLTDPDERAEFVDKCLEELTLETPLRDYMVELAYKWGLENATAAAGRKAAAETGPEPGM